MITYKVFSSIFIKNIDFLIQIKKNTKNYFCKVKTKNEKILTDNYISLKRICLHRKSFLIFLMLEIFFILYYMMHNLQWRQQFLYPLSTRPNKILSSPLLGVRNSSNMMSRSSINDVLSQNRPLGPINFLIHLF